MDDYILGLRRYLAALPSVQAALGSDPRWDVWLFQTRLYVTVEGSQSVAAVLEHAGSWTAPNRHNTARFPRLRVTLYADPERDARRNVTVDDTWTKLVGAWSAIDRHLHRTMGGEVSWGGVRVFESHRLGDLDVSDWSDGDRSRRAEVYYGLGIG